MNAAMDTSAGFAEEMPSLATIKYIEELEELRKFICGQLDQCLVKVSVSADKDTATRTSEDEVHEKVAEQKQSLIDLKERTRLPDDVLRAFLNSQEAFKAVYSELFPVAGKDDKLCTLLRSSIREKLMLLHQLNKKIYKAEVDENNLKKRLHDLEVELSDIIAKNKESMRILEHPNKTNTQERLKRECEEDFPEVFKEKEELEAEVQNLRIVKHIFQGLIHASKKDWHEDPELCNLLIALGETADAKLSDIPHDA